MAENFTNLVKEEVTRVQEVQRAPNYMNPKIVTSRYIIIKKTQVKDKDRILKASRKRQSPTRELA